MSHTRDWWGSHITTYVIDWEARTGRHLIGWSTDILGDIQAENTLNWALFDHLVGCLTDILGGVSEAPYIASELAQWGHLVIW